LSLLFHNISAERGIDKIYSFLTCYQWDETGILLGISRTHAPSQRGTRAYQKKAFYRGAKVTAIGAISMNKVLALMTMNDSMDGQAFAIFIQHFLCPKLWKGAVVVMDNLPAHKLASIKPMIESVGASIICLSPYSPDFNRIASISRGSREKKVSRVHKLS
ncbi:transposase, partial [Microcoleus sp. Pol17_C1]|uniref:transposase n=1 Tax=unclassified Microcoleus TaxID=2642155 RepID=UPI002FD1B453